MKALVVYRVKCALFLPYTNFQSISCVSHFMHGYTPWKRSWAHSHMIITRNLSVCLSVCVFLKYLCGSGSDWAESFNMAAAWFKGVPRQICLDCNDTVNKLFHKCFTHSTSIVHQSHHSQVRTRANHYTPEPCANRSQSLQSSLPQHKTLSSTGRYSNGVWKTPDLTNR